MALDKIKSKSFRNHSRTEAIDQLQYTVDSQVNTSTRPEAIGLREIVRNMKIEYQLVIDLIYYQGYTHVEAAEALGIPLGTLKTRLRMAVNDLRQIFG